MTDLVFVYGTLKRGFRANYMLDTGTFLGEAETPPIFRMFGSAFPWLYLATGKDDFGWCVRGEVYEINEPTFRVLDRYEGCPGLYFRQKFTVRPLTSFKGYGEDQVNAWIYFQRPNDQRLASAFEVFPNAENVLVWEHQT